MKYLLPFCLVLHFAITLPAQYADSTATRSSTDYLKKSKNQKTAAWKLLGGGLVMTSVGMAIGVVETTDVVVSAFSGQEQSTSSAGPVLLLTGLAAMIGSIPLFIASGKNRTKAASLSFKNMMMPQIKNSSLVYKPMPAVSLRINL